MDGNTTQPPNRIYQNLLRQNPHSSIRKRPLELDLAGASTGCLPRATAVGATSALGSFADVEFLVAASSSDAAEAGRNVELNIAA
ncbi:hypothetical protein Nepgr_030042 [Nepenthes gracilis]|uniref:Uncharacterized protein n=1 Tax=Nepenthes gracilis TaxID=150966 RepID=A0AAD3Y5P4_NEPGR|nr:hypothetical protein Nepgr_030042 [Nepenthes gracilis]